MSLVDWADASTVATAIIAGLALAGAVWQVSAGRRSQLEATASTVYGNYLSLAVQYPRLASAYVDVSAAPDVEFESYEWFVSLMLHAFEQILALTGGDKEWETTIQVQLDYHLDYLSSDRFVARIYSKELRRLFPKPKPPASDA